MDFIFRKNIVNINEKKYSSTLTSFDLIEIKDENKLFLNELDSYFALHIPEDKDIPAICLIKTTIVDNGYYNYDDNWEPNYEEEQEYKEINNCPFTGEKINIVIKETIDATYIYNELENELKQIKGHSYKKEVQRRELQSKIYSFYNNRINCKIEK